MLYPTHHICRIYVNNLCGDSSCAYSGMQGCRNLRDGGESVQDDLEGPFFTYLVYQSFVRPSYRASIRSSALAGA